MDVQHSLRIALIVCPVWEQSALAERLAIHHPVLISQKDKYFLHQGICSVSLSVIEESLLSDIPQWAHRYPRFPILLPKTLS